MEQYKTMTQAQRLERVDHLEAASCAMREALEAIVSTKNGNFWKMRAWCDRHGLYIDDLSDERAWVAVAEKSLSCAPVCPHKEEAEKLRQELAVGEAGGRLLRAVQEKTEAEVAALQAALDEANGKIMEAEFKLDHQTIGHPTHSAPDWCHGCKKYQGDWNERHGWPRDRWTEEAKAVREKNQQP